jgi:hypothetical protein
MLSDAIAQQPISAALREVKIVTKSSDWVTNSYENEIAPPEWRGVMAGVYRLSAGLAKHAACNIQCVLKPASFGAKTDPDVLRSPEAVAGHHEHACAREGLAYRT